MQININFAFLKKYMAKHKRKLTVGRMYKMKGFQNILKVKWYDQVNMCRKGDNAKGLSLLNISTKLTFTSVIIVYLIKTFHSYL